MLSGSWNRLPHMSSMQSGVSNIYSQASDPTHYNSPDNMESPEVTIYRETAMLDMLGLVFLLTFSSITYAQIIGMVLHRWQTCNYFLRLNHQ